MRNDPARDPRCERCSKPCEEVLGMIAIHKDARMPTLLCWDCVDDLKKVADYCRKNI